MTWFRRSPTPPHPFGLSPRDDLGAVYDAFDETGFIEAVSKRPSAGGEPTRSFVGNVVQESRYRFGAAIALGVLAIFLARAGWLQIAEGASYRAIADSNRTRTHVLPAERGIITDVHDTVLAHNVPSFSIIVRRSELPTEDAERNAVLEKAASVAQVDVALLRTTIDEAGDTPDVEVAHDVPYERALAFAVVDNDLPGVDLVLSEERAYITDTVPSLSHVLGYTGVISDEEYRERKSAGYVAYDRIGKQGVEKSYETLVRGTYGTETIEVDARGRYLRTIAKQDPEPGATLRLGIDVGLQSQIEQSIAAWLKGQVASRVAVVAMDPRDGTVRALVSWPAYDANVFAQGIDATSYETLLNDPDHPLFPRAYAGEYPAGSTVKPLYAAAALTEGIITPSTSFVSTGGLQVGNRFFPDWRAGGHGITNVYHAIADSVNTFFYSIGGGYDTFQGLGIDRLMSWASTFGLGGESGLDVPGEANGFLPSKAWKEAEKGEPWYIGDTYNVSIGQGDMLVSPVQIARMTSVFANGGTLVTPHVVAQADLPKTTVVSSDVATVVRDGMRQTVTNGSATSLQQVPVSVAGKTGTAQWSHTSPPHSWFTGFAPFDDPTLVITVIVEDGGDQGLAIPIAREVLTWYFGQPENAPTTEENAG